MLIPQPTNPRNFWVVDGNHPFHDALVWVDQLKAGTVKVFSVDDFVNACIKHCTEKSVTIDFLAIFGHGDPGCQGLGCGQIYDKTGTKSLDWKGVFRPGETQLVGLAEESLKKLNGLLSEKATIFLAGCKVGADAEGAGLLKAVSGILNGRTVQAFEWKVAWWLGTLFGTMRQAKGSAVTSSFATYQINETQVYI